MEQDAIWMLDKAGLERGGCCMSMTLRDYARVGLFMMGGGKIDGKSIVPDGYIEDATSNHVPAGKARKAGASYGYFWWPMDDGYRGRRDFRSGHLRLSGGKPRYRDQFRAAEGDGSHAKPEDRRADRGRSHCGEWG